jgi:transcriptional regulator with XRE-family HTH domain
MGIQWKNNKEELIHDLEIKSFYDELELEFSIAKQLARLRRSTGLSQREFSQKAGIQQPQLARIEAGKQSPRLETLATLASSAGFSLEIRFVPNTGCADEVISCQVSQGEISTKKTAKQVSASGKENFLASKPPTRTRTKKKSDKKASSTTGLSEIK